MSRKARTIDIEEDLQFQRKEWIFQRIGVAALGVFVLAALLGLTGMGGPLSRGAKATMRLHVHSDPPGFIQFWVSAPYLEHVIVDSVAPVPQTVTVEGARHLYTARAASPDVVVTVEVDPAPHHRRSDAAGAARQRLLGGQRLRRDGKLLRERAEQEGVTIAEVLAAGREHHGLERLEQVKYAILERHGGISVVPTEDAR